MTRRLLALTLVASALSACQLGGDTERFVPSDRCTPIQGACGSNADCCSYGCLSGVCVPNPVPGGVCRTSDDCGVVTDLTGFHYMGCKSGACTTEVACRDDADVCDSDNDCCSGNCVGATWGTSGACTPNSAPVVELGPDREIPYNRTTTLAATVSDPDAGDTLVYGWTLVSAPPGSTAAISSPTVAQPTFVPNVPGAYRFRLTVTDGPVTQRSRVTASDEVTLTAINTAPVVALAAGTPLRSVLFTVSATVSDADGDQMTCTWTATAPPGGTGAAAGPTSCGGAVPFTFLPDAEGVWKVTLEVTDGVNPIVHSADLLAVNEAPVASAGPDRVGNLGEAPASSPAVPLRGGATDANGDVNGPGFKWTWTVVSTPAGPSGAILATTQDAQFVPDQEGTYTLRLRVEDGFGGAHDDEVLVDVHPYVRPILSATGAWDAVTILEAAYLKASDRIVLLGTDRSGATPVHRIWVVNPAAATSDPVPSAVLGAAPSCISVSADGTAALVGEQGAHWQLVTGLPDAPAVGTLRNGPFTPNDVVYASASDWFAFGATGVVYRLDPVGGGYAAASCSNCSYTTVLAGTRATGNSTHLWMIDESRDTIGHWYIRPNGDLEQLATIAGQTSTNDLWLSSDGVKLFTSTGASYVAATLATDLALPVVPTYVDTSTVAAETIAGIATRSAATELTRFDAGLQASGTLPLPKIGVLGEGYQAYAQHAFLSSDGSLQLAVIRAQVPTDPAASTVHDAWGIVTYP